MFQVKIGRETLIPVNMHRYISALWLHGSDTHAPSNGAWMFETLLHDSVPKNRHAELMRKQAGPSDPHLSMLFTWLENFSSQMQDCR